MIERKKIFNIIYAIALFVCVLSCVTLLFSAINYTQLAFHNYHPFWTHDQSQFYNTQFIVMSWLAFSFMFLTLMSLLLKMFVDKKGVKWLSTIIISLTVVCLIGLIIVSFFNITYYTDSDKLELVTEFYIYMLDLRTQLITSLVALSTMGVCMFVDYKSKKKTDMQLQ